MQPSELGQYRLLATLGHGGMADVYLATSTGPLSFNKLIVIKTLRSILVEDPHFLEMFLDEARLACRLNHPNVVQTHSVGSQQGRYFLAMDFLDGQPLHRIVSRLSSRGGLPTAGVVTIISASLAGLHYAHELHDFDGKALEVVHRDVTPQNLFVTYDGQIKVVDFGIAKAADSMVDTRAGVLKGKVGYMPPEQARGEPLDRRADIYSLGVILWECLSGQRLWKSTPDAVILSKLAAGEAPPLDLFAFKMPARLLEICRKATDPEPARRYRTAEAFREALLAASGDLRLSMTSEQVGRLIAEEFASDRARLLGIIAEQLKNPQLPVASFEKVMNLDRDTVRPGTLRTPAVSTGNSNPSTGRGSALTPPAAIHDLKTPAAPTRALSQLSRWRTPTAWTAMAILLTTVAWSIWNRPFHPIAPLAATTPGEALERVPPLNPTAGNGPIPTAPGDCNNPNKPVVEISGDIDRDSTLHCSRDYLLKFTTYVKHGATLTIEKGTRLLGDQATKGVLVVQPGGRIIAQGTETEPIVFTSDNAAPAPGDWGGVIILGNAPVNLRGIDGRYAQGKVEGITAGALYGGSDPRDDSGVLSHVRIEYAGTEIAPNNEINGLTLAGVGSGTKLDHIQVRHTSDDCFEFFGGTVDAKYLVCQQPGDDGFDWDLGYAGRMQFLVYQGAPKTEDDSNGFEGDNDPNGSLNTPISSPQIWNATLCGRFKRHGKRHFGALLRRATQATIANAIFTGFDAGVEIRDSQTKVDIRSSNFVGNSAGDLITLGGIHHPPSAEDDRIDPVAFLLGNGRQNFSKQVGLSGCDDPQNPDFKPAQPLVEQAQSPPDDGFFDPAARFVGAFRDSNDDWAAAPWVRWQ